MKKNNGLKYIIVSMLSIMFSIFSFTYAADPLDEVQNLGNNNVVDNTDITDEEGFNNEDLGDDTEDGFDDENDVSTQGNYNVNVNFVGNDYDSTFKNINRGLSFLGVQNISYMMKLIGMATCLNNMGEGKIDNGISKQIIILNGNCRVYGQLNGYLPVKN